MYMSKHISKRTHLNSVHRQMTIKIPRKEGERKIKWQPLAVETERRKEQTFSRRWVRTCPEGFIISHWGERGGNRVQLYFTVFLIHISRVTVINDYCSCGWLQFQTNSKFTVVWHYSSKSSFIYLLLLLFFLWYEFGNYIDYLCF